MIPLLNMKTCFKNLQLDNQLESGIIKASIV